MALALAAAAIAACAAGCGSGGGVTAGGRGATLDRTLSCPTGISASTHRIFLTASAAGGLPQGSPDNSGSLDVLTAATVPGATGSKQPAFVELAGDRSDVRLDSSLCRTAGTIPLGQGTLPSAGVATPSEVGYFSVTCTSAPRVLVRVQASFDAAGRPVRAALAVRDERSGKAGAPIAYVTWQPKRVAAFLAARCR